MSHRPPEPVAVGILAKAPVPGYAKTRLIPELGPDKAAALQERFIECAVETACNARVGPVSLWCAPDVRHPAFVRASVRFPLRLATQPNEDLGHRIAVALRANVGSALVIGTDCPGLTCEHLRNAAALLRSGTDVVLTPAEDGGYVLVGTRRPLPALFTGMPWSTETVMAETRSRLLAAGISWAELPKLRDIDTPADLKHLPNKIRFGSFIGAG